MNIVIAIVVTHLLSATASCNVKLTNADFERKAGHQLLGETFHCLLAYRLNDCIVACTHSYQCMYMNVLDEDSVTKSQCQLFNVSTMINTSTLIQSENSVFYKKSIIFKDCLEMKSVDSAGGSGIYPVVLPHKTKNQAFCDITTSEGGWTLLQRRIDGSIDFDRDWQSYKIGFGNLESNFWLGLDAAHLLMKDGGTTLRFELWDGPMHYFMEYHGATIADEADNYRIVWSSFEGNTTDAMAIHKGMQFTTKDRDNDLRFENCAVKMSGGWWYGDCHQANFNGIYGATGYGKGLTWKSITGYYRSLTKTEIKVKLNG